MYMWNSISKVWEYHDLFMLKIYILIINRTRNYYLTVIDYIFMKMPMYCNSIVKASIVQQYIFKCPEWENSILQNRVEYWYSFFPTYMRYNVWVSQVVMLTDGDGSF